MTSSKISPLRRMALVAAAASALVATAAVANEVVTYEYDARGRLKKVERTGTVNNGAVTTYTTDKADNRTNKNTVSAPAP